MTKMKRRVSHFGAGIIWGMIPSSFPVFWIAVPGFSRNGYGTSPNLWVQKRLVKFWQGTQDTRLCPTEFFWEFLTYPPFDPFRNVGDVVLSRFRVKRDLCFTVSSIFGCFFLFLNVAMKLGEKFYQQGRLNLSFVLITMRISSYYEERSFNHNANSLLFITTLRSDNFL